MIKCAWASLDSKGGISGDAAGNQNGKELRIGNWYKFGQTSVYRFIDRTKAVKFAELMKDACNNMNIGYDQNQRTSLFFSAQRKNFDMKSITEKCECDCSSLVATCLHGVGIPVDRNMTTWSLEHYILDNTNEFEKLTSTAYLTTDKNLMVGDIINAKSKHVIVSLENGNNIQSEINQNDEYYPRYTGTSNSIVDALKSLNIDSSVESRIEILNANGFLITDHKVTANHNIMLLQLLKNGKLKTKQATYPKYNGYSQSFTTALASLNIDNSLSFRRRIAEKNMIENYEGTYSQNIKLFSLLKNGALLKP